MFCSIAYLTDSRKDIERRMISTIDKMVLPVLLLENTTLSVRLFLFFSYTSDSQFFDKNLDAMIFYCFAFLSNPDTSNPAWSAQFYQIVHTLNICFAERDIRKLLLQNNSFYAQLLGYLNEYEYSPLYELSIKLIEKNPLLNPVEIFVSSLDSLLNLGKS